MHRNIMQITRAYKSSEPVLHYVFINRRELCAEKACELSEGFELGRIKLSGLVFLEMYFWFYVLQLASAIITKDQESTKYGPRRHVLQSMCIVRKDGQSYREEWMVRCKLCKVTLKMAQL